MSANHYPYNSGATSAFDYYVGLSWYFVAFKVTADSHDPPDGGVLCGDLGPIQLAFPAASPVVPARIVGAPRGDGGPGPVPVPDGGEGLPQSWRVFTIDDHQTSLAATPATLRFSGALSASDIATHQAVAQLGVAGNRITEFEVDFWPWLLQSDLVFQPAPADTDFRRTEYQYQYVSCPNDAGPPEADSSVIEGGPGDAIVPFVDAGPDVDATVADAGPPADASPEGASSSDATLADATIADATVGDASVADASAADSSPVETSSRDATADAAGSYGVAGGAGGCSCRNAPGEPASAWAFVLGALPVVMVLRARRRGARAR